MYFVFLLEWSSLLFRFDFAFEDDAYFGLEESYFLSREDLLSLLALRLCSDRTNNRLIRNTRKSGGQTYYHYFSIWILIFRLSTALASAMVALPQSNPWESADRPT